MKQVHELATCIYQIRGHIKGRTLLPFPQVISGENETIPQCCNAGLCQHRGGGEEGEGVQGEGL